MKKIVSILAVAALATSVFAADVAAQFKVGTNLYANKAVLTSPESSGWDDNNTFFKLTGNLDAAGAEIHVSDVDASLYGISLWFSPIENLKVTVGNNTVGTIEKGTFAWWAQSVKLENVNGIKVNYNIGDLGLEFLSANNALLDFNNSGYDIVGDFWLAATYGLGDAGNVQAFVSKGAAINAYGVGGWMSGALVIGAAYDHMPWQQTGFYGDAFVSLNGDMSFQEVGGQIGGQYAADGLALRLTNMVAYGHKYGAPDATFSYGFAAKAEYALGDYTPYLQILGHEVMDGKLGATLGCVTNMGGCEVEAMVQCDMDFSANTYGVSVPVTFKVAF